MSINAYKLQGNAISQQPDRNYSIRRRNIDMTVKDNKKPPPTASQLALIASMRQKLNEAGVGNDFIIEPDTRYVASHVIRALIRLGKKHNVDTGKGNRSLYGV